jgi:hypothetical protein
MWAGPTFRGHRDTSQWRADSNRNALKLLCSITAWLLVRKPIYTGRVAAACAEVDANFFWQRVSRGQSNAALWPFISVFNWLLSYSHEAEWILFQTHYISVIGWRR